MAELSVAIIGCGAAGSVHIERWSRMMGVHIAAVCDENGQIAARTAGRIENAAAFTRVQDLLGMQTFDIVDVCTPSTTQYEIVASALQAGAHVLCETPFTGNPEQARLLAQLAHDRERLLMPGLSHRFHPQVLFALELRESDDLGRPSMFRLRLSESRSDPGIDSEGQPSGASFGGPFGQLIDTLHIDTLHIDTLHIDTLHIDTLHSEPHSALSEGRSGSLFEATMQGIDLYRAFCGDPDRTTGILLTAESNLNQEEALIVTLGGARSVGVVEAGWNSPGGRSVVEIYGTAGACLIDYDAGTLRYRTADQPVWNSHEEGGPDPFEREIAHFADAVRGLQTLHVTAEDGVRAVEICSEVYRQNGR